VKARTWTIAGAANAQIELELNIVKRAYTLAMQSGALTSRPHVPRLQLNNVRRGFFEAEQFAAVRRLLPEALQPVVTFLFLTGWRVDAEVLPLEWRQIDFQGATITLDPGTTKNGEGRVFPMTPTLRTLLLEQRQYTDQVQKERSIVVATVFHRKGKPIRGFRRAWLTACKRAGCPGKLRHDFRRTAVRNLVRASVPEKIAQTMTGHLTREVFDRYDITSDADLREAGRRLEDSFGTVAGQSGASASADEQIS
jgi:integrase